MKYLLAVIAVAISLDAAAQTGPWKPITNSMYVLPPSDGRTILLAASVDSNTHKVAINVLNLDGILCAPGENRAPQSMAPISINGQFVKFLNECINGTGFQQPETDAGKSFLNSSVFSGRAMTLDIGVGEPLRYPASDFGPVQDALLKARDAM